MGHIQLHDFRAGDAARVGHVEGDFQRFTRVQVRRVHTKIGIGKRSIRKPMPEGITDRHLCCVIIAIADEDTLTVLHRARVTGEIGMARYVAKLHRPAFGELAGRVHGARHQIGNCASDRLAAEVQEQD
ncbi:hypothetical protein SDC9_162388 [bioreactor metagenome]|uniref:Uncharacterized protein n=1 Tax=bioreactor metagenome TaxID=1076179 RepID=A0A645FNX9_9ZZZZ